MAVNSNKRMRMMRLAEVLTMCGLSRSHLYALVDQGKFPRQVKLSSRAAAWVSDEVEHWIQARIEDRDQT